ncbi:MAG: PhnD/SsuA/transferrin family substrate-binding protein, partial [Acidobacteria bacterium]|nr:PhnD/SsuA/transferrin family substrate-binding protein [Acidobacteriota bacterium]
AKAEGPAKQAKAEWLQVMAVKLASEDGRALYKLRQQTVEPVFGIIKAVLGFTGFSMRGLDKVAGRSVSFTSATSTSGGVFPQLQLFNEGIDIEDDIEYSYLVSHTDSVAAVYNGDFDIGLSFDDARRGLRNDNPDVGSKVIVFNITDEIPNDIVAVRGELPDELKQAIFDATKAFLATEEGEAIFDEIYGWTDVQEAIDSDFDVVREAAVKLGVSEG